MFKFKQIIERLTTLLRIFRLPVDLYQKCKFVASKRGITLSDWFLMTINATAQKEHKMILRQEASHKALENAYKQLDEEDAQEMNELGFDAFAAVREQEKPEVGPYKQPLAHACIYFVNKLPFGEVDRAAQGVCIHPKQNGKTCIYAPQDIRDCKISIRDKSINK